MDFVTGTFIDSFPVSVKLIIAALIVIALLALVIWMMRWLFNKLGKSDHPAPPSRLAVVEAANIDGHRRMVLVRRDNVEHLVMIGGSSDVLIEANIGQGIHTSSAYQQAIPQAPETLEELEELAPQPELQEAALPELQVAEFEDIFSPTETAELTKEPLAQPPVKSSWRDKAGSAAAVLTTASLASDRSQADEKGTTLSTGNERQPASVNAPIQAEEATFSGLTNVLDAELSKNAGISNQADDAFPPSLSSPDISTQGSRSDNNQANNNTKSAPLQEKQVMEDEMQRLLNELTGEKT